MSTIGIAIDSYKLAIFKKHFDKASFVFEQFDNVPKEGCILLRVKTDLVAELAAVARQANEEATRTKFN